MSTDPSMKLLLEAARHDDQLEDHVIMKELRHLATTSKWEWSPCIMQDVGNYLTKTMTMLSTLSQSIINGEDIESYARDRVQEAQDYNDLSELDPVDYLHEKHAALKLVARQLEETAKRLNNEWRISRKPPFGPRRMQHEMIKTDDYAETVTSGSPPQPMFTNSTPPESPVVFGSSMLSVQNTIHQPLSQDVYISPRINTHINTPSYQLVPMQTSPQQDSIHDMVRELLRTLSQRGTGQHTCPYGRACTKGGVEDGDVKVFERNSAFRAHLQKHEKMFKCHLPGCNAKGGFARIDQLKRHQQTVPHNTRKQ